jgi:hypothetical protein
VRYGDRVLLWNVGSNIADPAYCQMSVSYSNFTASNVAELQGLQNGRSR